METLYSETYVDAEPSAKRKSLRIGLIVLCVVLLATSIILMNSILLFVAVFADALILVLLPSKKIAYEYIFVDGQIDFDVIYGGERRKHLLTVDLEITECVAPYNSHELDPFKNIKETDYSSGRDDKHFVLVYRGEKGEKGKVKFTPDEKMLTNMEMKAKSKIKYN